MTQPRKEQIDVLRAYWSAYTYTATGGTTSTVLPGGFVSSTITQTSGGDAGASPARGIVTSSPNNFVKLRKASDALTLDDSGAQVFGRLTFGGGNYTVTYRKIVSGSEVSATLPGVGAISVQMTFPEVMRFGEVPANADILYGSSVELVTTGSTIASDLVVNGNTTLGDSSADTLTFNARLATNFVPSTDNVRSVGTSTLRFAEANSFQFTARADNTDTVKSVFSSGGIATTGTTLTLDANNIVNLGTSSATQLVLGRTGITVDIDGIIDAASHAIIGGNLTVNGASSIFNGNVTVNGTLTFTTLGISGNTILGDSSSDTIVTNARLASNLLPSADAVYSLGSSSLRFFDGHYQNLFTEDLDGYTNLYIGASQAIDIEIGNSNANITLNSPITISCIAGETLSAGELVAFDNDGGQPRIFKAEADGYGDRVNVVGVAAHIATAGTEIKVILCGEKLILDSEWDSVPVVGDVGKLAYLSMTAGNWTLVPPSSPNSYIQKCGIVSRGGTGTTRVIVQIGDSIIN